PAWSLANPLPIRYEPNVTAGRERCCSRCDGLILSVPVTTVFVAIRESIQHQEVEIQSAQQSAEGVYLRLMRDATSISAILFGAFVGMTRHSPYAPNFSSRNACASSNPIRYLDSILPSAPLAQAVSVNAVDPSLRHVDDTSNRGTGCQL